MPEAATAHRTVATVELSDSSRYLKQLCRHFGHKVEVEFSDTRGTKRLPGVLCEMYADTPTALRFVIDAESAERAERHQGVIERHLVKFAFREDVTFDWSTPEPVDTQLA